MAENPREADQKCDEVSAKLYTLNVNAMEFVPSFLKTGQIFFTFNSVNYAAKNR